MNKTQLVEKVAESTSQSKLVTKNILEGFFDAIGDSLSAGSKIEIRGFGSFKVKERKARVARNPRTGEEVQIPSRTVPTFKPSRSFGVKVSGK
jgi:nucleoid DNA-binding protein